MLQMHLMQKCIWCWTFSFGKCSASHFTLENVQHHILLWKMFSTNKMWCFALLCKNTFLHQIHFCIKYIFASNIFLQSIKCICNILLCKNAFDAKMLCFLLCKKQRCVHFVLQKCIWCKNAFDAKMHLMQKCIWCKNAFWQRNAYIFQRKMFSCAKMHFCITFSKGKCSAKQNVRITFSKGKCSAKQNVTNAFDAVRCKNAFLHQMHFCITFCFAKMHLMLPLHFVYKMLESGKMHFGVHFPKENVQHQQNVTNAFDATLTFCLQNVRKRQNAFWLCKNAFDAKMHFCNASHFPKENVQRIFDFVKCSASHFPKENVQHHIFQRKMFSTNKMWCFALQKCIWCKNVFLQSVHFPKENVQHLCFLQSKKHSILASNTFLHQIHFCTAFVFCCAKNTVASNGFVTFCFAEHFPLENVQQKTRKKQKSKDALQKCCVFCFAKNKDAAVFGISCAALTFCWCWTFSKAKCYKCIFAKQSVHFAPLFSIPRILQAECRSTFVQSVSEAIWLSLSL